MKHKILLAFVSLLCVVQAFGQVSQTVSLTFAPSDFTLADNGDGCNLNTLRYVTTLDEDTLAPALPYVLVNVLMRPGYSYSSMTFTSTEEPFRENVLMASNPKIITTNMPLESAVTHASFGNATYPASRVRYMGENVLSGYKYASFLVCPFSYDASTRSLTLHRKIDLALTFKGVGKAWGGLRPVQDDMARKDIQALVINKQDLADYYPVSAESSHDDRDYKYLIVTCDSLKPVFQQLADWKTTKGVRTKVETVEDIYRKYSEKTRQLSIKRAVYDYYKQYGIEYVLLGGDVNVVPVQMCHPLDSTARESINLWSKETPSDLFYACFDAPFDWDANGNGVLAEYPQDGVVLNPLLCICRASVVTVEDARVFVERTLEYECRPDTMDWNNNILLTGAKMYRDNFYLHGCRASDAQYDNEDMFKRNINPYWSGGSFVLCDTWTDAPERGDYPLHTEHLQKEFSKGYKFVNVLTHGAQDCWQLEDNYIYQNRDALALKNKSYSLITSMSCDVNGFDASNGALCLSEALMRNPYGKVMGFWGNVREGIYIYIKKFLERYYEGLFRNKIVNYGRINQYVKEVFQSFYSMPGYRWLLYTAHSMGDAEMPVYTECPQALEGVGVSYNQGLLTVKAPEDCRICISAGDKENPSYYAVKDSVGQAVFGNVPETYTVCVTKHNCIPYVQDYILGEKVCYMQNADVRHDMNMQVSKAFIGRDVTVSKASGPVAIHDGNVRIESEHGAFIKNGFSVKKGAQMKITIKNKCL